MLCYGIMCWYKTLHWTGLDNNECKMYSRLITLVLVLLTFRKESSAQILSSYTLTVVEDATVERGFKNFDYLQYLIVGLHPDYPKKRSLLRFENVPSECTTVIRATMYLYYLFSHKFGSYTNAEAPFIARTIQAHRVLKSWKETEATSTKRDFSKFWSTQWLGLDNSDAKNVSTGDTTIYPGQSKGFVEVDVTSAVNDWKAGQPNYGVVIWATNENIAGRDTRFASKSESDFTKHPYIVVICNSSGDGIDVPTLPTTDHDPISQPTTDPITLPTTDPTTLPTDDPPVPTNEY